MRTAAQSMEIDNETIHNNTHSLLFRCSECTGQFKENENEIRILSAYHGLDPLPPRATRLCGLPPARGQDGMPVAFSVQINGASISAAAFAVETTSGEIVTPLCATLRPAIETLEQRTVLLIGPFSIGDSLPVSVEIVGQLEDVDGNSLVGLKIEKVTPSQLGPVLYLLSASLLILQGLKRNARPIQHKPSS